MRRIKTQIKNGWKLALAIACVFINLSHTVHADGTHYETRQIDNGTFTHDEGLLVEVQRLANRFDDIQNKTLVAVSAYFIESYYFEEDKNYVEIPSLTIGVHHIDPETGHPVDEPYAQQTLDLSDDPITENGWHRFEIEPIPILENTVAISVTSPDGKGAIATDTDGDGGRNSFNDYYDHGWISAYDDHGFGNLGLRIDVTTNDYFNIDIADNITNGTITPNKTEALEGEEITLNIESNEGYQLKPGSLKANNEIIEETSFIMPAEDVLITAEFIAIPSYTITVKDSPHGSIFVDKTTAKVGETVEIDYTTHLGYGLMGVYVDGELIDGLSFIMPEKDVEVSANFEKLINSIIINDMKNGSLTSSQSFASMDEMIELTITPDKGYQLLKGSLKVNGVAIEGTTFKMPNHIAYIDAEFELIPVQKEQDKPSVETLPATGSVSNLLLYLGLGSLVTSGLLRRHNRKNEE